MAPVDPSALAADLKLEAERLGLSMAGIAAPDPTEHLGFYREWVATGRHGEMAYLARPDAVERRGDLRGTMADVRSVLVVADAYGAGADEEAPDPSRGIIARYARGRDYHKVLPAKLRRLHEWLDARVDGGVSGRIYVDTGPILERDLARRAGLGWFGRNTMLIHPQRGSYFFLGALLLDLELPSDEPFAKTHCGTCRACVAACPTGALLGYDERGAPVIEARRCISYLTIELKGPIPEELRPRIGNRVFGCDICQEVCPFNVRFAREAAEPGYAARGPGELPSGVEALAGERAVEAPCAEPVGEGDPGRGVAAQSRRTVQRAHPGTSAPPLVELMRMTRAQWDAFSRGSAIRRAGYAGFRRNVAVALGNWLASAEPPPAEAVGVLRDALEDESELVREHAAWALGRVRPGPGGRTLRETEEGSR